MLIALTGTPGTGKTSVSNVLRQNGFEVVDLNKIAIEKDFLIGTDEKRNSRIIDVDRLSSYVKKGYEGKDFVFIDGHVSHLLKSVDRVIILRCHPDVLKKRLIRKRWKKEKIKENVEAEMLDIILCEAIDIHAEKKVFEIDTTGESVDSVASSIKEIIRNKFKHMKKYNIGNVDWSEEILKDF